MNLQQIKSRFMAMRNGIVADALRKGGMPHKVIFGLNVPQLSEIATSVISDREVLAEQLWADREVRESRLLACWLFDPTVMPEQRARMLIDEVRTREEADILAFRTLRRLPYARALVESLTSPDGSYASYAVEALARNLA